MVYEIIPTKLGSTLSPINNGSGKWRSFWKVTILLEIHPFLTSMIMGGSLHPGKLNIEPKNITHLKRKIIWTRPSSWWSWSGWWIDIQLETVGVPSNGYLKQKLHLHQIGSDTLKRWDMAFLASPNIAPVRRPKPKRKETHSTDPVFQVLLLMEEILHQLISSLSHYLQGCIYPGWCRISSINRMIVVWEGMQEQIQCNGL